MTSTNISSKRSLVAALASLAGLLLAALLSAPPALAVSVNPQRILVCDADGQTVAANSIGVVTCTTSDISLTDLTSSNSQLSVEYVGADASGVPPRALIASIEATMNFDDDSGNTWDFFDVAFSPYANVPSGGQPPANITLGATNSPNIDLLKDTIQSDPNGGSNVTKVNFQLQVFVRNRSNQTAFVSGSLRVIVSVRNPA